MDYTNQFKLIDRHCKIGNSNDIDIVMEILDNADLPITRAVDLYLGYVSNQSGIDRLEYYLFSGSQIQRNYCTLFFARRNNWELVNRAYNYGLIDAIQAYSR